MYGLPVAMTCLKYVRSATPTRPAQELLASTVPDVSIQASPPVKI